MHEADVFGRVGRPQLVGHRFAIPAVLAGLELADLVVTPIGRNVLGKPDREDYAIVES